jgi:hypothetical protein
MEKVYIHTHPGARQRVQGSSTNELGEPARIQDGALVPCHQRATQPPSGSHQNAVLVLKVNVQILRTPAPTTRKPVIAAGEASDLFYFLQQSIQSASQQHASSGMCKRMQFGYHILYT